MKTLKLTKAASLHGAWLRRFMGVLERWAAHVTARGYTIEVGDDPARSTMIWQAVRSGQKEN